MQQASLWTSAGGEHEGGRQWRASSRRKRKLRGLEEGERRFRRFLRGSLSSNRLRIPRFISSRKGALRGARRFLPRASRVSRPNGDTVEGRGKDATKRGGRERTRRRIETIRSRGEEEEEEERKGESVCNASPVDAERKRFWTRTMEKKSEGRMKNRSGGGRNEETAYDTAVNCEPTKDRAVRERGRGKSWTVERELSDSR